MCDLFQAFTGFIQQGIFLFLYLTAESEVFGQFVSKVPGVIIGKFLMRQAYRKAPVHATPNNGEPEKTDTSLYN